jgi:hypothetical protein
MNGSLVVNGMSLGHCGYSLNSNLYFVMMFLGALQIIVFA